VLAFVAFGVLFWWLGRPTRAELIEPDEVAVAAAD
jgi:hypothetical protein